MAHFFETPGEFEQDPGKDFFLPIIEQMRSSLDAYDKYKKKGIEFSPDGEVVSINVKNLPAFLEEFPEEILKKGDKTFAYDQKDSNDDYLVFVRRENPAAQNPVLH